MADVGIGKHKSHWLWIIGGAIVLLVIAFVFSRAPREEMAGVGPVDEKVQPAPPGATVEAPPVAATPAPIEPVAASDAATQGAAGAPADAGRIPVVAILADPSAYTGRQVSGTVRVADVPTPRGFWIEDGGRHMLVLLDRASGAQGAPISQGQTIRLTGTVQDGTAAASGTLDPEARQLLGTQRAYLLVAPRDVSVM